ncbi:hypothetical protein [Bradyrhizobium sp. SZCCHNR3118]|uniref:hypothetical protein n=1 Tax=Bradyrhizobium sp. SZCCHNR3118 TaxID=3057468 RepID=UPI002916369A|nr:hypothetical protein [Bradyrhizobium sp. SZCCHNR3118]
MKITLLRPDELTSGSSLASELLAQPMLVKQASISVPLFSRNQAGALWQLWLHAKQKRTCWYFKALHEYEAFITTGSDESSPRQAIDAIDIHIQRDKDNANYAHSCGAGDYCAKSDEIFYTGGACSWSIMFATAHYQGVTWSSQPNRID